MLKSTKRYWLLSFAVFTGVFACDNSSSESPTQTSAGTSGSGGASGSNGATGGQSGAGQSGTQQGGSAGSSATGGSSGGVAGSGAISGNGGTAGVAGAGANGGTSGNGGSAGGCDNCGFGYDCCDGQCVYFGNDIYNCGQCGSICDSPQPYCDHGVCGTAPCDTMCADNSQCCGNTCCSLDTLCCAVPGPIGDIYQCVNPVESGGSCPLGCLECICNSPDTLIATPNGERAIADLKVGDLVYSINHGAIEIAPIALTHSVKTVNHVIRRVTLSNGNVLKISGAHPTADGRVFAQLNSGDRLFGQLIVDAQWEAYRFERTYDILPESSTGAYFAHGVLIGSTLVGPKTTIESQ